MTPRTDRIGFQYLDREVDPLPGEFGVQIIYEPVITARVIGPRRIQLMPGLLDTGSALTVLPFRFAGMLGVNDASAN